MATINKLMVGESLVGEGNEVAHIDLIIGPRGSAAETAWTTSLATPSAGYERFVVIMRPGVPVQPFQQIRRDVLEVHLDLVVRLGTLDHQLPEVLVEQVPDDPHRELGLLVQLARGLASFGALLDAGPRGEESFQVCLEIFGLRSLSSRAHDQAMFVRLDLLEDVPQSGSFPVGKPAADPEDV